MIGTEAQSGISDQDIKDTLWHYYYDVQQSVDYLLGQFHLASSGCHADGRSQRNRAADKLHNNVEVSL